MVLLTRNLAIDYGRQGIRANAICPGFIETPMTECVFDMEGMERGEAIGRTKHKLRRLAEPEEIAAAAAFLLSPDASFVTGQAIAVDGGVHRRSRPRRDGDDGPVRVRATSL